MIKNLVEAIKEQAENIQNVKYFSYEGADLINAQNNNATIQVFVEDDIFTEYLVTKDLVKVQMNIDILDNIRDGEEKVDTHDRTTKIAIVLIKLIEENYKNILSVYDYNLLMLVIILMMICLVLGLVYILQCHHQLMNVI